MSPLEPNAKELRALRLFVSSDVTRQHLTTLWRYESDGGTTYVATDGHTMGIRRAGTHREMPPCDIAKFEPKAVDEKGEAFATVTTPPAWHTVLHVPAPGKLAAVYGVNTDYIARVGDVERAAGQRAAEDFVPAKGESKKGERLGRAAAKSSAVASWRIPSDPLDGWHWHLDTQAAHWAGVIMPRRV